jgi:hypothetical protein
MGYNKNVVEEALFQIRNLEETLQENAKGILQSTMSEEIKQLVKESLKEQDEPGIDDLENPDDAAVADDDFADDDDDAAVADDDFADDDDAAVADDDFADDDDFSDEDDSDDDETIDLTGASDDEVLRVFKLMGDDDNFEVRKDGENIRLTDGDDEYMIQLGESENDLDALMREMMNDPAELEEWGQSEFDDYSRHFDSDKDSNPFVDKDEMEETIYEIELDDMGGMKGMGSKKGDFYEGFDSMEEGMDMYADSMEEGMGMYEDSLEEEMGTYADSMEEGMGMYEDSLEEDIYESIKKSIKPKGVGIGHGPKFGYDKKPNMDGGFSEKKKEAFGKGTKAMGTGKARFEYKEEKEWGGNKGDYKRKKEDGVEKKTGEKDGHYKDYMKKKETKEASRTLGNGSKDGSRGLRKSRTNNRNMSFNPFKLHETESHGEMNLLREKNEEYRKALDVFRTKLNEVAVFNSNLAYATRLFTEHSTTKQEKINILKRFDTVESLKESKNLYRTIKNELSSTGSSNEQSINESIERKVINTVQTGSATNLIESKTYENPQFLRMKDLMSKL